MQNCLALTNQLQIIYIVQYQIFFKFIFSRLEPLDAKSTTGIAKIMGTIVSLAGAMTMTLYKGPVLKNLWSAPIHIDGHTVIHKNWLKGSLLAGASCVTWSIWYIMQVLLRRLIKKFIISIVLRYITVDPKKKNKVQLRWRR